MKKIICVLLLFTLCSVFCLTSFADTNARLLDGAEILSPEECELLGQELDSVSQAHGADIVVVTVDSVGAKTAEEYADDFYDYGGYSKQSGVLFLLSLGERKWHISTTGEGIDVITDAGLEAMSEEFLPDLKEGNYFDAFMTFARQTDKYYSKYETDGVGYDVGDLPKDAFDVGISLIIALVAGVVIGFIGVTIMKGKLKTVKAQTLARDYEVPGSMQVTGYSDIFLYSNVVATPKPQTTSGGGSSTHTGSSGTFHGGGGGSF